MKGGRWEDMEDVATSVLSCGTGELRGTLWLYSHFNNKGYLALLSFSWGNTDQFVDLLDLHEISFI